MKTIFPQRRVSKIPVSFVPVFTLLLASALLTGCTSSLHVASTCTGTPLRRFNGGPIPVYVTNPELTNELQILKASKIYKITDDCNASKRLTLFPVGRRPSCGNGLIGLIFTLGIIPVSLPDTAFFRYDLETDGQTRKLEHVLPLYERFSIWEWAFKWNDRRAYARALAFSKPGATRDGLLPLR